MRSNPRSTAPWNPTRSTTLATIMPTRVGVDNSPSQTMSVVAHAGGWMVSVAINAQLVSTMEAVALAASRMPPAENAAGVAGRRPAGQRPPGGQPGTPADQVAPDDPAGVGPFAPAVVRQHEGRGPEAREDEGLSARPGDGAEHREQEARVETRADTPAHHRGLQASAVYHRRSGAAGSRRHERPNGCPAGPVVVQSVEEHTVAVPAWWAIPSRSSSLLVTDVLERPLE